jgi:hypothetical protein
MFQIGRFLISRWMEVSSCVGVWVGVTVLGARAKKSFTTIVECDVHLVSIVTTSSDDSSGWHLRRTL